MKVTSRILIRKRYDETETLLAFSHHVDEYVLQQTTREAPTIGDDSAPEPLLPNYGNGRIRRYYQDVNMMISLNSKERTLQEFIDIGWVLLELSLIWRY